MEKVLKERVRVSFAEIGVVQPRKFTTGWPRCRVTLIETFLSKMRDVGCNPASDLQGKYCPHRLIRYMILKALWLVG